MKATKEVEATINGILKKWGMHRLMTQVVAIEVWNAAVEGCAKGIDVQLCPYSVYDSILSLKIEDDENN